MQNDTIICASPTGWSLQSPGNVSESNNVFVCRKEPGRKSQREHEIRQAHGFLHFVCLLTSWDSGSSWSTRELCPGRAALRNSYYFLKKQAVAAAIGLSLLFFAARMDYRHWQVLGLHLLILSAALLTVLILPGMRHEIGGSARWLKISFLSFQPAELAKLALVIYLSRSLTKKERRMKEFAVGFLPHMVVLAVLFALVLKQPDFGTGIIFAFLVFLMLFAAGASFKHLGATALAALPVLLYIATRRNTGRAASRFSTLERSGKRRVQIINRSGVRIRKRVRVGLG
jgi:cell division protein FtsW (lipid II flippase)